MSTSFDSLSWNRELSWWSGRGSIARGHEIDLHVEASNDTASLRSAIARATQALDRLLTAESSVRLAVADQLVRAHNDSCDPDDEVTPSEFANRLRLLSVRFEGSGSLELVYVGERLLGEHWIVVPIGADGRVGEAAEAG